MSDMNSMNRAVWFDIPVADLDRASAFYSSVLGIKVHREKKTLNEKPLHFDLARFHERGDGPLFFPGKVAADAAGGRLFIADSTHHRIVITDLEGRKIAVAGAGTAAGRSATWMPLSARGASAACGPISVSAIAALAAGWFMPIRSDGTSESAAPH